MLSTDPLLTLRQAIQSRTEITYAHGSDPSSSLPSATHIVLSPTQSLPKSAPTRLRKPGATSIDPSANPQDFFTIEAVYLAWLLRDASGAEYMKQARENGLAVGFVSVTERKNVVDWLEGGTSNLDSIIPLACGQIRISLFDLSESLPSLSSGINNTPRVTATAQLFGDVAVYPIRFKK